MIIITFSQEVMFSVQFVCLPLSRIVQNLLNQSSRNLMAGCSMSPEGTRYIVESRGSPRKYCYTVFANVTSSCIWPWKKSVLNNDMCLILQ